MPVPLETAAMASATCSSTERTWAAGVTARRSPYSGSTVVRIIIPKPVTASKRRIGITNSPA